MPSRRRTASSSWPSNGGVFEIDPVGSGWRCESGSFGQDGEWVRDEDVNCKMEEKEGKLRISFAGYGLVKFDPEEAIG